MWKNTSLPDVVGCSRNESYQHGNLLITVTADTQRSKPEPPAPCRANSGHQSEGNSRKEVRTSTGGRETHTGLKGLQNSGIYRRADNTAGRREWSTKTVAMARQAHPGAPPWMVPDVFSISTLGMPITCVFLLNSDFFNL